jgi:hypothetical protein
MLDERANQLAEQQKRMTVEDFRAQLNDAAHQRNFGRRSADHAELRSPEKREDQDSPTSSEDSSSTGSDDLLFLAERWSAARKCWLVACLSTWLVIVQAVDASFVSHFPGSGLSQLTSCTGHVTACHRRRHRCAAARILRWTSRLSLGRERRCGFGSWPCRTRTSTHHCVDPGPRCHRSCPRWLHAQPMGLHGHARRHRLRSRRFCHVVNCLPRRHLHDALESHGSCGKPADQRLRC